MPEMILTSTKIGLVRLFLQHESSSVTEMSISLPIGVDIDRAAR